MNTVCSVVESIQRPHRPKEYWTFAFASKRGGIPREKEAVLRVHKGRAKEVVVKMTARNVKRRAKIAEQEHVILFETLKN